MGPGGADCDNCVNQSNCCQRGRDGQESGRRIGSKEPKGRVDPLVLARCGEMRPQCVSPLSSKISVSSTYTAIICGTSAAAKSVQPTSSSPLAIRSGGDHLCDQQSPTADAANREARDGDKTSLESEKSSLQGEAASSLLDAPKNRGRISHQSDSMKDDAPCPPACSILTPWATRVSRRSYLQSRTPRHLDSM
jgi:hypothetical protein